MNFKKKLKEYYIKYRTKNLFIMRKYKKQHASQQFVTNYKVVSQYNKSRRWLDLGKSKQRIIARAKNDKTQLNFTRQNALAMVIEDLANDPASISAKNMITLFGLKAEELSEAGLSYEVLRSLDCLIGNFCSYNYKNLFE